MARLFTEGFEFGDSLFWTTPGNISATPRTGVYSSSLLNAIKNIPDLSELYFRCGIYWTGRGFPIWFRHGSTQLVSVGNNAFNQIEVYVGGSSVANSGLLTISINAWHLLEIHLKIDDSGLVVVYVDGIKYIDYSGDTKPGADTHADNMYFHADGYIDDIALNDTTGGVDNSWCGDGHIELLTPVTGGTYQWTGSDGDSVDNYALVDDIPASGDDYVKDSTAGHQDIYSLSDFTGTGKIITRVWPECRAKDNDNTAGQIKLGMKSGGTTHLGSAIALSGAYARVVGDEETLNPDDSGAWEDADLDALQFVVECE